MVHLNLTIAQASTSTDFHTVCDSLTWIDGNTYYASNSTATHVLSNAAGCDSIVTLNLTVQQSSSAIDVQTACDSLTWIDGITYYASNSSATHTLTNASGCDSVVHLNLTIAQASTSTDFHTVCDSLTWIDGNTYYSNNTTATYITTSSAGCDSVVVLNLTVTQATTGIDVQTSCGPFTWVDGNTYAASTTTASHTLISANGCDSVVTLHLTVLETSSSIDVHTVCDSLTWIDGNTYFSDNNTASVTLTNAAGCDSTVALDLTVTTIDTEISVLGSSIFATAGGVGYQWLDCDSANAPIAGATDQGFQPTSSGNYAVELTLNGCEATSECEYVMVVGNVELGAISNVSIYPNPASNDLYVAYNGASSTPATIVFSTMAGVRLQEFQLAGNRRQHLDLHDLPVGVYVIEVVSGQAAYQRLLIKQ